MARTPREQNILTALPALLVLIVYLLSFSRQAELTQAAASLEAARAAAVSPAAVDVERTALAQQTTEHNALKGELTKLQQHKAELVEHQRREPGARAGAMRRVTRILWDHGLTTIAESAVEGGQGQLPDGVQNALRRLAAANPPTSANAPTDPRLAAAANEAPAAAPTGAQNTQLWEVRFYGKYANVLTALEKLAGTDLNAVPVGLKMDKTHPESDGWRIWTLTLWL